MKKISFSGTDLNYQSYTDVAGACSVIMFGSSHETHCIYVNTIQTGSYLSEAYDFRLKIGPTSTVNFDVENITIDTWIHLIASPITIESNNLASYDWSYTATSESERFSAAFEPWFSCNDFTVKQAGVESNDNAIEIIIEDGSTGNKEFDIGTYVNRKKGLDGLPCRNYWHTVSIK